MTADPQASSGRRAGASRPPNPPSPRSNRPPRSSAGLPVISNGNWSPTAHRRAASGRRVLVATSPKVDTAYFANTTTTDPADSVDSHSPPVTPEPANLDSFEAAKSMQRHGYDVTTSSASPATAFTLSTLKATQARAPTSHYCNPTRPRRCPAPSPGSRSTSHQRSAPNLVWAIPKDRSCSHPRRRHCRQPTQCVLHLGRVAVTRHHARVLRCQQPRLSSR